MTYPKTYTYNIERGRDITVLGPFMFVPEKWTHVNLEKAQEKVTEARCCMIKTQFSGLHTVKVWYEFQY